MKKLYKEKLIKELSYDTLKPVSYQELQAFFLKFKTEVESNLKGIYYLYQKNEYLIKLEYEFIEIFEQEKMMNFHYFFEEKEKLRSFSKKKKAKTSTILHFYHMLISKLSDILDSV